MDNNQEGFVMSERDEIISAIKLLGSPSKAALQEHTGIPWPDLNNELELLEADHVVVRLHSYKHPYVLGIYVPSKYDAGQEEIPKNAKEAHIIAGAQKNDQTPAPETAAKTDSRGA